MGYKPSKAASQALRQHKILKKESIDVDSKVVLRSRTDYTRWRLLDERGRHTWHYLKDDEATRNWPQSIADKYFLGLPTV
jgi:hypothetical protein